MPCGRRPAIWTRLDVCGLVLEEAVPSPRGGAHQQTCRCSVLQLQLLREEGLHKLENLIRHGLVSLFRNVPEQAAAESKVPQGEHHHFPSNAVQDLAAHRSQIYVWSLPTDSAGVVSVAKLGAQTTHNTKAGGCLLL